MADYINNAPECINFVVCAAKYQNSDGDDYVKKVKTRLNRAMKTGRALVMERLNREDVAVVISHTHVGWSIRNQIYRESSEISTKVIEYCSLGKPVLLNKFDSNIALLGEDYPCTLTTLKQ